MNEELFNKNDMEELFTKLSRTRKCKKCSRFVTYPCDDAEGFYESGPWDYACDMWFNPHRYQ